VANRSSLSNPSLSQTQTAILQEKERMLKANIEQLSEGIVDTSM